MIDRFRDAKINSFQVKINEDLETVDGVRKQANKSHGEKTIQDYETGATVNNYSPKKITPGVIITREKSTPGVIFSWEKFTPTWKKVLP